LHTAQVVQPGVQVDDRLVLLVQGEEVSQANDLVWSHVLRIQLVDSVLELIFHKLLSKAYLVAHDVDKLVVEFGGVASFAFLDALARLLLLWLINNLSKDDTKIDIFVDHGGLDALESRIDFTYFDCFVLLEESVVEVLQVEKLIFFFLNGSLDHRFGVELVRISGRVVPFRHHVEQELQVLTVNVNWNPVESLHKLVFGDEAISLLVSTGE